MKKKLFGNNIKPACKYCDYAAVCGRENAPVKRVPDLKNEEVLKLMGEETANGI